MWDDDGLSDAEKFAQATEGDEGRTPEQEAHATRAAALCLLGMALLILAAVVVGQLAPSPALP